MSYNGSGTFQINTSGQPVVAGTVISSTAFNALTADLATGLSTAITKDGQTTTTARIPFAAGISSTLTTDSSSVSTGSIITAGGAGIAKNLYVGVNANVAGTLGVTGVATFSAAPIYSSLTASSAVATDASKALVSVTNTGTGNNVLATSPTLVTPILGTPTSGSLVNCTDTNYTGFKNRIINGAMVIDQRNAGAVTTPTNAVYTVDRWRSLLTQASKYTVQQNAASVTPPAGFRSYLGITSSSAYSVISSDYFVQQQFIEGYNFADLSFGTASAATITISFWVRSSLTGTFGGSVFNNDGSRCYAFTYTISVANTWEQKSVTIAGDTTGTWNTTSLTGLGINFGLGVGSSNAISAGAWSGTFGYSATGAVSVVGTSGATWYVTGVQLEKGSTATSFDYRPIGTELALCQRYYEKTYNDGVALGTVTSVGQLQFYLDQFTNLSSRTSTILWLFKVSKRATPTITTYSPAVGTINTVDSSTNAVTGAVSATGMNSTRISVTDASTTTAGTIIAHATASSEL